MKFIIETEQILSTTYEVEAENISAAKLKFRSGEAEEVDQYFTEETISEIYYE